MRIVFLFIDGVGMRAPAPDNPVNPEVCPTLCRLIARHAVPVDACLSTSGLPQSATGQATMFTGVNAPVFMGRHCEGFPGPSLRKKIEEDNLFLQLKARGKRVRFADAYLVESADELVARRFKSVTTVMALTAPEVRDMVEAEIAETVRREFPGCEALMGTATAGIAHAAIAAHLMGMPMGYVRSGSKDHGRKNRIEGKLTRGEKVVVIEDLISTAGSVVTTVEALREAGAEVLGVISICTYGMERGIHTLEAANVRAVSLTDIDTITAVAVEDGYISEADAKRVLAFRDNPLDESWRNT